MDKYFQIMQETESPSALKLQNLQGFLKSQGPKGKPPPKNKSLGDNPLSDASYILRGTIIEKGGWEVCYEAEGIFQITTVCFVSRIEGMDPSGNPSLPAPEK